MPDLILLTGGTGHIGFQVLLQALKAGYRVRCAVRSDVKGDAIRTNPVINEMGLKPGFVDFAVVPDITVAGAYDEAIKDCTYAIHVASAIPSSVKMELSEADDILIKPAVKGTLSILQSAKQTSSIKRVVITSSAVAVVDGEMWRCIKMADGKTFKPTDRNPSSIDPPFKTLPQAYGASKTAALQQTEQWIANEKPTFSVVNVHPGYVIGRNELAFTEEAVINGTNNIALRAIRGIKSEVTMAGCSAHIEDVARIHVAALGVEGIENGTCKSYAVGAACEWEKSVGVVQEKFPHAVKDGRLPLGGEQRSNPIGLDVTETEELLGSKLKSFDETIVSVVG